jgi:curved DNA-binding protein CbpA
MNDLYEILDLHPSASAAAVEQAYRELAREHHPDRNPGDPGARARFQAVQDAYDVLSDPDRRARYDTTGDTAPLPTTDSEAAHLTRVLSATFVAAVRELLQMGVRLDETDVVAHMRGLLDATRGELRGKRAEADRVRAGLKEAVERFRVDDGENLLAEIARVHLGQLEGQVAELDAEAARMEAAQEHLRRYRYQHDKPQDLFRPGSWRSPGYFSGAFTAKQL